MTKKKLAFDTAPFEKLERMLNPFASLFKQFDILNNTALSQIFNIQKQMPFVGSCINEACNVGYKFSWIEKLLPSEFFNNSMIFSNAFNVFRMDHFDPFAGRIGEIYREHTKNRDAISRLGFTCFIYSNIGFIVGIDESEIENYVFEYSKSESFRDDILRSISIVDRFNDRYDAIDNALCLHNKSNYHASCMIISSQIEGIVNDFLDDLGLIYTDKDGTYKVCKCGDLCKKRKNNVSKNDSRIKIDGLRKKLTHAKDTEALDDDFIDAILCDMIDGENSINQFRNKMMHGDSSCFPSIHESAKLLYWLSGLIVRVCETLTEEPVDQLPPSSTTPKSGQS